jgi:hypothetical protein
MRRFIFILAGCAVWLAGYVAAPAESLERATEGQDVKATLSSPFSALPPGGSIPFRVTIRNDGRSAGTWHVVFRSATSMYPASGGSVVEEDLSVAANASGAFDVLVPAAMGPELGVERFVEVGITGPGFNTSRNFGNFFTNNTRSKSPFAIFGSEVLGPAGTGMLESWYKDRGKEFYGSEVDASALPSDWRAYSGVAAICLKDSEWLGLNSAQHDAVCEYVAQGGELVLFTPENVDARAPQLQLPEPDGKPGPYGYGVISLLSSPVFPPSPESLVTAIKHRPAISATNIDEEFSTWNLRHLVGIIAVNRVLIILFILVFGALVAPINMFVFAPGKKRFRLFWTTPLISIVASLALAAGILLTDGVGGEGRQMIAIYSLPDVNREVVIQEQVTRTALLFSSEWQNSQNYLITPISEQSLNNAADSNGTMSARGSNMDFGDSSANYIRQGDRYSGDWFRSRAVSGQYLEAIRPSRSALTVLNPSALQAGQAPTLLSSFPQKLTRVYLIDPAGNYWTCADLEPGRKQTCTSSTEPDFNNFWFGICDKAGGELREALGRVERHPGYFFASGIPPAGDTLNTLHQIHWQVVTGIYLGPWVASSTPENAP